MGLETRFVWTGGFVHTLDADTQSARRIGRPGMPTGVFRMMAGTGVGQAQNASVKAFSIGAGAYLDYDLKGGTGELNLFGSPLVLTVLKLVTVVVTAGSVRVGPQGRTNACQLWFQAVTTNFYDLVADRLWQSDKGSGWSVGSSTKILALNNPGGTSATGFLIVAGV